MVRPCRGSQGHPLLVWVLALVRFFGRGFWHQRHDHRLEQFGLARKVMRDEQELLVCHELLCSVHTRKVATWCRVTMPLMVSWNRSPLSNAVPNTVCPLIVGLTKCRADIAALMMSAASLSPGYWLTALTSTSDSTPNRP
jgi:hypothetical protein